MTLPIVEKKKTGQYQLALLYNNWTKHQNIFIEKLCHCIIMSPKHNCNKCAVVFTVALAALLMAGISVQIYPVKLSIVLVICKSTAGVNSRFGGFIFIC